jgi:hypothetical protein
VDTKHVERGIPTSGLFTSERETKAREDAVMYKE